MNYLQYTIECSDADHSDLVVADLADLGFDSFSEFSTATGTIEAYVTESDHTQQVLDYFAAAGLVYETLMIKPQSWNTQWESDFQPITVDDKCYIRATFHEPASYEYEVVITPKMSFGTGHHPTTHLMVQSLLNTDLKGLKGLDMGSGTGILAILAVKLGADAVDAVDIDEWAYENCVENIRLNEVLGNVRAILGDAGVLDGQRYDFVLANINRNILLADMAAYTDCLKDGGTLTVSGFLEIDIDPILNHAERLGLSHSFTLTRDGWAAMRFIKR